MNYTVKYSLYDKYDRIIKQEGIIKVKNKKTKLHALISLETYLKKKHPNAERMVVIDCVVDNWISDFFMAISLNDTERYNNKRV